MFYEARQIRRRGLMRRAWLREVFGSRWCPIGALAVLLLLAASKTAAMGALPQPRSPTPRVGGKVAPARSQGAGKTKATRRALWLFSNAAQLDQRMPDKGGGLGLGFEAEELDLRPGFVVYGGYRAPFYIGDASPLLQLRTMPVRAMMTAQLLERDSLRLLAAIGMAATFYESEAVSGYTRHLSLQPSAIGMRWSASSALIAQYRLVDGLQVVLGGLLDCGKARERLVVLRQDRVLPRAKFRPAVLAGVLLDL